MVYKFRYFTKLRSVSCHLQLAIIVIFDILIIIRIYCHEVFHTCNTIDR